MPLIILPGITVQRKATEPRRIGCTVAVCGTMTVEAVPTLMIVLYGEYSELIKQEVKRWQINMS